MGRLGGDPSQETNCTMINGREVVSIAAACERVGVSRKTIYNWLNAGKIEAVRTAGGAVRIFADTLMKPFAADPSRKPRP